MVTCRSTAAGFVRGGAPLGKQLFQLDACHLADSLLQRAAACGAQDFRHHAIAKATRQIRPHRRSISVRRKRPRRLRCALRQQVEFHRVSQPHRRFGIVGAERQILGHAFDTPQRPRRQPAETSGHVELKCVRDLVPEHLVGLGERGREGDDDSTPRGFGDAADAFAEESIDDVGLGEFRLAAVQDQRLPVPERMSEHPREARVPSLGQSRGEARRSFFARVVIDSEVLGVEHLEVEGDVLDLVPAELLRAGVAPPWPRQKSQKRHGGRQRKAHELEPYCREAFF